MTLLKYLKTIHEEELTDTDLDILDHLEKQLPLIPNLTISELAQKIYTSSTSLHRLVKKLGFDGYTEFKYIIEDYLKNEEKEDVRFSYLIHSRELIQIAIKIIECSFDTEVSALKYLLQGILINQFLKIIIVFFFPNQNRVDEPYFLHQRDVEIYPFRSGIFKYPNL